MIGLQPWAEGQTASLSMGKSFSQQPPSPIQIGPVSRYKGEAAVVFSKEEADKLAAPFRLTLVGKFSHGRLVLEEIRKFF